MRIVSLGTKFERFSINNFPPRMNWQRSSSLQLIINDLNEIAAEAYRHRIRPRSKKGGNGVYDTSHGGFPFLIPQRQESNRRARFEVTALDSDMVCLKATSLEDSSCFLKAKVNGRGRLVQLESSIESPAHSVPSPDAAPLRSPELVPFRPHVRNFVRVFEDQ